MPSGRVRLMVMGRTPLLSSIMAIKIGSGGASSGGMRMGAPMAICSVLVSITLAYSYFVSVGGPMQTSFSRASVELTR